MQSGITQSVTKKTTKTSENLQYNNNVRPRWKISVEDLDSYAGEQI